MYIPEVDKGAYSDHFFNVLTTTMGNENDEEWQEPRRRDIEESVKKQGWTFSYQRLKENHAILSGA